MLFDNDFSWLDDDRPALETDAQLPQPIVTARQVTRRAFVAGLKREALSELIPQLPPPDTDLYVIGNGAGAEIRHGINPQAFDFGSFVPVVVRLLGEVGCTAYVSTWTMNRGHAKTFLQMLDDGRLAALTVVTGRYFKRRESTIYTELVSGLQARGQRYLAFANHCKIIAVANADSTRFCTITGSANLSAQPRCEQYVLTTAPAVYRFFVDQFFEAILTHAST
jgi:hypothetical protein